MDDNFTPAPSATDSRKGLADPGRDAAMIPAVLDPMTFSGPTSSGLARTDVRADFAKLLRRAAEGDLKSSIITAFPWETKLSIRELLKFAREKRLEIRLLTGCATEEIYDSEVREKIQDALDAECRIRVLAWTDRLGKKAQWLEEFRSRQRNPLELKTSGTTEHANSIPHFLLVGTQAYRLESPHIHLEELVVSDDDPSLPATVCFYPERVGERERDQIRSLTASFDLLWSKAPVEIGATIKRPVAG